MCAVSSQARADNCADAPAGAVTSLPEPLAKWGALACTRSGYIISNNPDWIWTYPGAFAPVILPSQMAQGDPAPLGNGSFFTRIAMTKVDGEEFQLAYSAFHEGFAPDTEQPVGYRLDLSSVSGQTLKLYFFDYRVRVWGIRCPDKCDRGTRFVLLNMNKSPEKPK